MMYGIYVAVTEGDKREERWPEKRGERDAPTMSLNVEYFRLTKLSKCYTKEHKSEPKMHPILKGIRVIKTLST